MFLRGFSGSKDKDYAFLLHETESVISVCPAFN